MILAYRYNGIQDWGSPTPLLYNYWILKDTFMPLYRYKIDIQTTLAADISKPENYWNPYQTKAASGLSNY